MAGMEGEGHAGRVRGLFVHPGHVRLCFTFDWKPSTTRCTNAPGPQSPPHLIACETFSVNTPGVRMLFNKPPGLQRVRAPCLFIARMALFDRRANRFLGNVLGVRPRGIGHADKLWEFNPEEQVIVRCGCVQVRGPNTSLAPFSARQHVALSWCASMGCCQENPTVQCHNACLSSSSCPCAHPGRPPIQRVAA